MHTSTRLAAAVAAAGLALLPAPASAVGTAAAFGSGSLHPGLTNVPTAQTYEFSLDFVGANDGAAVVATGCRGEMRSYSGPGETTARGSGDGTLSGCTTGQLSGSLVYERYGTVLHIQSGGMRVNGSAPTVTMHAVCPVEYQNTSPSTQYAIQCTVAFI